MELGEKEGAESTSERDKSARKSGGYVVVSVIKGQDRRRGERERDKSSDSQVEGNERDAMEGAEYDGRRAAMVAAEGKEGDKKRLRER